ncbi:MAG: MerR family transcriptional regulator [Nitrospirota bacterium]
MEKRYHLKDLTKILGIGRNTYYNWEQSGKIPKPKRDPMSRFRYWTEKDIRKLRKITGR